MYNPTPKVRTCYNRLLLRWYRRSGRTLPWRTTRNPYRILVSEVMLQQTQVNRVLAKYPGFLRTFPTLSSLAYARRRDVILAWQGLGYNTRAVRLHRLAELVVQHHHGQLRADEKFLRALPGVGKYTARALLVSGFRRRTAAVDINGQRVLSRVFWKLRQTSELRSHKSLWALADQLVSRRRAYDWNQALMDLGALVCRARAPRCPACPLESICASRGHLAEATAPRGKPEPSLDGIPNRIYRGRIVTMLRRKPGAIPLSAVGRAIHARFSRNHQRWLETLVISLERDGLVTIQGNGSFNTRRVSLA